jgi:hypothetical protein
VALERQREHQNAPAGAAGDRRSLLACTRHGC